MIRIKKKFNFGERMDQKLAGNLQAGESAFLFLKRTIIRQCVDKNLTRFITV